MTPLALGQAPASAAPPTLGEGVSDVRIGLIRLGTALASASQQPALSDDLPLTDTSVRDLLALDTAIGTLVEDALETAPDTTLNTLDDAFPKGASLVVKEVADSDRLPGAPVDSREWILTVALKAAKPVALTYQDERLEFGTAALDKDLAATLDATIRFRYDPKAIDLRKFAVVGSADLTTHVWTSDDGTKGDVKEVGIRGFKVVDGFVQLDASGKAEIDSTTVLTLRDPNGRGQITTEDLEFSSAAELFTTKALPAADAVRMQIDLRAPMKSTSATGSVTVGERVGTSTYAVPTVNPRSPALEDLSSLTRLQAITGFTQYTSALQAAEASVDQDLPLLDLSLTDLFSPAQQLLGLLTEQATASVVCGAANTFPPTGAPRPGQVRYCQAVTSSFVPKSGSAITWKSPDTSVEIKEEDHTGTVGRAPTKNIAVTGGNGFPTLRVGFTSEDGKKRFARSAVTSIQDLGQAIGQLGLDGTVDYDPTKKALQIAVHDEPESDKLTVATGGNGNLAPLTGLAGLCQAAKNSSPRECRPSDTSGAADDPQKGEAEVTLGGQSFTADFGIGLTQPTEVVAGDTVPAEPTFYLLPGKDGLIYQVDTAEASLAKDAEMVARIGFLQVDVDVTKYTLSKLSPTGKAASLSVPTETITLPSTKTVSDAVAVTDLLSADPAKAPTAERGLTATAELDVRDSEDVDGKRPIGAAGTVTADWKNLLPSSLPTVATGGDFGKLRLLDIVPARQALMGPGTGNGVIKDPGADFLKQFGLTTSMTVDERTVTRPLYDLGVPGSSSTVCTRFVVADAHELRCTEGPLAEKGAVAPGHPYVIDGDQDALRDVVIENLAAVLNSFATPDPKLGADRTFPLVDVLPTEISAARDGLGKAVKGIQDQVDGAAPTRGVSSMQDFSRAFNTLLDNAVGGLDHQTDRTLDFSLSSSLSSSGAPRLILESSLETAGTRDAPLRVAARDSEVKVTDEAGDVARLPLDVTSEARFVIGVDLADASSRVRADSGVIEKITKISGDEKELDRVRKTLAGKATDYGSAVVTTGDAANIKLGIGVKATTSPKGSVGTWVPVADLPSEMQQTRTVEGGGQTCGVRASGVEAKDIAACLELPIVSTPTTDPVMVALQAEQSSGGAGGAMALQPIAYRFLAEALGGLNLTLADGLDGDQTLDAKTGAPLSLPLVGTNLDAGADVTADIDLYVSRVRTALKSVEGIDAGAGVSALTGKIDAALGSVTGLVANKMEAPAGTVVLDCAGACIDATGKQKTVADVDKISVPVVLRGIKPPTVPTVPFQAGPAGSTIVSDLEVPVQTTWELKVTVGIARGTGPFVKLADATAADPLLKVDVSAQLPTYSEDNCHAWERHTTWKDKQSVTDAGPDYSGASGAKCLDAYVGKFPSVMVDRPKGDKPGTFLNASIVVDVTAPSDAKDGVVYLPTLFDKLPTFETTATGTGGLSTYFESFAGEAGFFDVLGTIDLDWEDGSYTDEGLRYGRLMMDVETLNKAVFPGFKKALAWTAPLNPVVDQLAKPIPVVTDLSELVGKGPVTLLTLLQSKDTPLNLIINLLQMQNIVAAKPEGAADLREIGANDIGGFKVSPHKLGVGGKCTETGAAKGKPFERTNGGDGSSGRCELGTMDKLKQHAKGEEPEKDPEGLKIDKAVTKSPYLSLPSVSVPVLQDTSQIFGLLQDTGDATMLYVDLGHAGVTGQIVKKFGPFAVGPIPVTASMGGTVGFDGRFAFGFDTRGLSKRINALDTGDISGFDALIESKPSLFSDGFYIDDLEKGVDVPEIQLTFTVQAGAAISLGIVEAGISGGVTLDLSLDAFDPNGDGKIYTDEFAGTSTGPACAFNVSSGMEFFLQFYFSIELFFYTIHKSFDIARSPRIKLFEFNCEVTTPVLAKYTEPAAANGGPPGTLLLTMGAAWKQREGFPDEKNEKYTVRQIGPPDGENITLQVSAFNLVENHTVNKNTVIRADGEEGSDTVRLYPMPAVTTGANNQPQMLGIDDADYVTPVFTAGAVVTGGTGADTIETSDGNDDVDGGDDNDVIRTGPGTDTLKGGNGNDQLDGGQGSDTIHGGEGDDRLNGGAGADELRGDNGDDVLDGGIGASPESLFPSSDVAVIRPLLDSGDLVVGGNGADTVNGGDGSDIVVGGAYDTAPADFSDMASVTVFALNPNRKILEVDVTDIPTVQVPDDDAVREQCDSGGATDGTGPDVVTGGGDRDIVIGGAGSDTLSGGGGGDVVCGRDGDDVLEGDGDDVDIALQGDDLIRGGAGRDRIYGSAGKDELYGDADDDLVRGGNGADAIAGGAGSDLLLGEAGIDTVDGDNRDGTTPVGADPKDDTSSGRSIVCAMSTSVVSGQIDLDGDLAGNDTGQLEGMPVVDGLVKDADGKSDFTGIVGGVVFMGGKADLDGNGAIQPRTKGELGDTGPVPLAGITGAEGNGDCILGGDEVDTRLDGGVGADYVDAGAGDDVNVRGGKGNDLVRGGDGDDVVHGDEGDDLVAGENGADILFGNTGKDVLRGGSGGDLLAGGSATAGAADGADEVLGDGGNDVVLGGNALLSRTALADTAIPGVGVTLLDTPADPNPVCVTVNERLVCDDQVYGGDGDDWVFGQTGDDETHGGLGTDVVEGGPGADRVQGDDGDDLLVGGSSTLGAVTTDRSAVGAGDGNDVVIGDEGVDKVDGSDVMVGDNARLQIVPDSARIRWQRLRGDVEIVLFDVPTSSGPFPGVVAAGSSGDDAMRGGGRDDLILGQSGDDTIKGGAGADAIEGGAGHDTLHGEADNDEIIGGSWTAGTDDTVDDIAGGDGHDVILGDNGTPANGFMSVVLHDRPSPGTPVSAAVFGSDIVFGGQGDDQVFGQNGHDRLDGDDGADLLAGGAGHDTIRGQDGDDEIVGGSLTAATDDENDDLSGGDGNDLVLGDNGVPSNGVKPTALLHDRPGPGHPAPAAVSGNDAVNGGAGKDHIYGQSGDDRLEGSEGDDLIAGGAGADAIRGEDGDDEIVGGSLTVATDDAGDDITGGAGSDLILGDNGIPTHGFWPVVQLHDVPTAGAKVPAAVSGNDAVNGGPGKDDIYGQSGDDWLEGSDGDDMIVGGAGRDTIRGEAGHDKIVGGSLAPGVDDAGDDVVGGDGEDLVLGDNGIPGNGFVPVIQLHDVPAAGTTASSDVSGNDTVGAGRGEDQVFGQGGNDTLEGNEGVDLLEGGAGADRLSGGSEDDVLTGGSSSSDGIITAGRSGAGQPDADDVLSGGEGDDVLAGDNARLERTDRRRADGTRLRSVLLFDLATGTVDAPAGTSGADVLAGDAGRDLVFGQGGNDALSGGDGDDYLEGNDGADALTGGAGEDDLVGGGSSRTGAVITVSGGAVTDRLLTAPGKATDITASGLVDGNDVLDGGSARDVLLGDNGRVTRSGPNRTLAGGASGPHVIRQVAMADKLPGVWSGSDRLTGGTGDDDLYGQFDNTGTKRAKQSYLGAAVPGDVLLGGGGDDAFVGDQGIDVPTRAAALGAVNRTVKDNKSFLREAVRPRGTLVRVVTLTQGRFGGDDLIMGNEGADSIHAGAGKDVINAGSGDDVVFAGDGNDALWGGAGHDRLFGGAGNDLLDVKRRASEPKLSQVAAPTEDTDLRRKTTNGRDVLYGGAGADALQADHGDQGSGRRLQGDRLIDWRAKVNVFQTCQAGTGPGKVTNKTSSSMVNTLRALAKASGAVGSAELAIPWNERLTKYPQGAKLVCETR